MKKYLMFAAAAIAMTACDNDDNYVDEPVAAHITATIGGSSVTRAREMSWDKDDAIGIFMDNGYVNTRYVTESGDGIFKGNAMYFKNKRVPANLTAYYPFTGTEGTSPGIVESSTVAANQTEARQPDIDFLYDSKTGLTGENPEVRFEFHHKMSKLTIIFNNGTGADVGKIVSYKIDGLLHDGTFDAVTGVCTAKTGGDVKPIEMTLPSGSVKSGQPLRSLILFPQAVADKSVTLTITDSDGQYYVCPLAFKDNRLDSGNNYQYRVTVNKTGMTVDQSAIVNWDTTETTIEAPSVNPK